MSEGGRCLLQLPGYKGFEGLRAKYKDYCILKKADLGCLSKNRKITLLVV